MREPGGHESGQSCHPKLILQPNYQVPLDTHRTYKGALSLVAASCWRTKMRTFLVLLLLAVVCASLGKAPAAPSLKGDRQPLGSVQEEHGAGEPSELGHWTGEEAAGNVEEASMVAAAQSDSETSSL